MYIYHGFFFANLAFMAILEWITIRHKLNWKPVCLYNHLTTAIVSNYLLLFHQDFLYNVTNLQYNDLPIFLQLVPIITCTYGIFDIFHAYRCKKGFDFIFHGIYVLLSALVAIRYKILHWAYPELLLETSSIFLTFFKCGSWARLLFVLTFFVYRMIIFPYVCFRLIENMDITWDFNPSCLKFKFLLIVFIHCLNLFWFQKIAKKIKIYVIKK